MQKQTGLAVSDADERLVADPDDSDKVNSRGCESIGSLSL
jgi:hypothetical protein